jgi:hypothetical protein
MVTKPRPKRPHKTHPRVVPARIKELATIASGLTAKKKHVAAFLLLYPAYEGLIYRACVKALWLRGYKVGEAEKFISGLNQTGENTWWELFVTCCGTASPFGNTHVYLDAKNYLDTSYIIRCLLLHGVKEPRDLDYRTLKRANEILVWLIENSDQVVGDAKVKTNSGEDSLGDPLENLRKKRRRDLNPKKLDHLPEFSKFWYQKSPGRPIMTPKLLQALNISVSGNKLVSDRRAFWKEPPITRDPNRIKAGILPKRGDV